MNNIEIMINRETKKVYLSKTIIGNEGENLQGNLIFVFDSFVAGQARLEFEIGGVKDTVYPRRVGETYQMPILSKLTKKGQIDMQLIITEGIEEDSTPIFKSNVFYLYCNHSLNIDTEEPEEYQSWMDIANTKLNQADNLNVDLQETEKDTTIVVTKKDGSSQCAKVNNFDDLKNIPTLNGVELKGTLSLSDLNLQPAGNYITKEELPHLTESDPTVPQYVKDITKEEIESWNNLLTSGEGTKDYEKLINLPMFNGKELKGNMTLDELGIQPKGNYADASSVVTKTSQLTNDSNFISSVEIKNIKILTQAEYDALSEKDANVLYMIIE